MSKDGRKEITPEELSAAVRGGMQGILDVVEIEAKVTVRDKDGNVKRKLTANGVEFHAT